MKEMEVSFSRIKEEEIPFLTEMLYEAIFVLPGQPPYPRSILQLPEIKKYVEGWPKDVYDVALVATYERELIGAIWGRKFDSEKKGFGFVDEDTPEISMAVKASYRGKGIGKTLLAMVEPEYLQLGIRQLSLSVDKVNPARRLYIRSGYQVVEEQETALTMLKQLE